jgi:hypothetical protein
MESLININNVIDFCSSLTLSKYTVSSTSDGNIINCRVSIDGQFICRYIQNIHGARSTFIFSENGRESLEKAIIEKSVASEFCRFRESSLAAQAHPRMLTGKYEDMLECIIHALHLKKLSRSNADANNCSISRLPINTKTIIDNNRILAA